MVERYPYLTDRHNMVSNILEAYGLDEKYRIAQDYLHGHNRTRLSQPELLQPGDAGILPMAEKYTEYHLKLRIGRIAPSRRKAGMLSRHTSGSKNACIMGRQGM